MLIKLMPDQISENWEGIKEAVIRSLPPIADANFQLDKLLGSCLSDSAQCWFAYDDENHNLVGILTTCFTYDPIDSSPNLLIYTVYGLNSKKKLWLEGMRTLVKYAKGNGCKHVLAYSNVSSIISFMEKIGADTSFHLIDISLEK